MNFSYLSPPSPSIERIQGTLNLSTLISSFSEEMKHVCNPRFSCIQIQSLCTELSMPISFSSTTNQIPKSSKTFSSMPTQTQTPSQIPIPPLIIRPSSLSQAPQRSDEWFALRKDRLTTSTFSTALGLWKGNRRSELWHEKVFGSVSEPKPSKPCAMEWGVLNESAAVDQYKKITGNEVGLLGFATHSDEKLSWIGASPDGLIGLPPNWGILEVKCPFNKGKPETGKPWTAMPFYYMPQVQGQMEVMDRDWVDLYCWTINGSTLFRVHRDRGYWELMYGVLREFWWENVVPAREAILLGEEEKAFEYKPCSVHSRTGFVIAKSLELAAGAKILCRETSGNVEFYSKWPISL